MASVTSCKKYLETKSVQSLATPSTLNDLQAILNNLAINNGTVLLNGNTDEYYFLYPDWQGRPELQKNGYIWDAQLNDNTDWSGQYNAVFNANTVLFNLKFITANGDNQRWNSIKGAALFYRALAFYRVAQLYSPQYDFNSATIDLGIPLRLNADINEESTRSSVEQTYDQIIADLNEAVGLLPNDLPNTNVTKTSPSKAAGYGLLARVYLQMGNYAKSKESANACLQIYSYLMDYSNTGAPDFVNPLSTSAPFQLLNPEVIFQSMTDQSPNSNSKARIDSNLYRSFDLNDWRRYAYFRFNTDGTPRFKGSYNGNSVELFCGIATDEIFLIRAECYAREGNPTAAMKDLNDLLRTRWKKNSSGITTYVDQTAIDANDALAKIIAERKKELINREIRWSDLKRLNKQPAFAATLSRSLNGQIFTLAPNDLRYSLLIPIEVMRITRLKCFIN